MLGLTSTCLLQTSQLCCCSAKTAMVNKWAQLCVNKTLFIKIGIGNSLPVPTLIHPIFPDVPLNCARIQKPSFPHSTLPSTTPENTIGLFPLSWVPNMGQILLALGWCISKQSTPSLFSWNLRSVVTFVEYLSWVCMFRVLSLTLFSCKTMVL